jgi:excisionase family DNA binding protein
MVEILKSSLLMKDGNMTACAKNLIVEPLLVSKRDAAALLGVCLRSIDNYIAAKELPCRRLGKRVLIPYAALVAFARRDHLVAAETAAEQGV